ncbi:MAG TPA: hypothetical protein VGF48_15145 [Thermoanaerobaculia bacterium]
MDDKQSCGIGLTNTVLRFDYLKFGRKGLLKVSTPGCRILFSREPTSVLVTLKFVVYDTHQHELSESIEQYQRGSASAFSPRGDKITRELELLYKRAKPVHIIPFGDHDGTVPPLDRPANRMSC